MATAKKSKKATLEVVQELPKNPQEYSYRGDELLEIPASLFLMLYRANDTAINQGTKREFPTATEWVSVATGMPVKQPKEADIKEGLVTQVMSIQRTFSQENLAETFEPWLYPDIIRAKDAMINIHSKAVEDGIATKITDLQAQAKADAEKADAAKGAKTPE
tara:strand:- start:299 stop:784 length:486 start_codon:yes stop_codon:yes gene_type:complete